MSSLVNHFGDTTDSRKPCGICDFCAPESCIAQRFRAATDVEQALARQVIDALRMNSRSVGKLHTELCDKNGIDRDGFEELVGAMARLGIVKLADSVFEKDGKTIPFRKASLTRDAEYLDEDSPLELTIREAAPVSGKKSRSRKKTATKPASKTGAKKAKTSPSHKSAPVQDDFGITEASAPQPDSPAALMLREWRRAVAKKQGVPAFRIMSDRVLNAIAEDEPQTAADLLAIPGIGIKAVEKYGAQIYRILNQARGQTSA